MNERLQWLEYKGKKILYINFSKLTEDIEFLKIIEEVEKELLKHKENPGSVYTISDVTQSHVNEKIIKGFDKLVKNTAGISKARATVGIKGIQKVIAQAIKKDMYFAATVEDAKDWFASQ